jgi:hypothetical protein
MLCYRYREYAAHCHFDSQSSCFFKSISDPTERKAIYLTPHKYNFSSTISEALSVVKWKYLQTFQVLPCLHLKVDLYIWIHFRVSHFSINGLSNAYILYKIFMIFLFSSKEGMVGFSWSCLFYYG